MNATTHPLVLDTSTIAIRQAVPDIGAFSPDAELITLAQEATDLTRRERGLYGEGDEAALFIKNDKKREAVTGPISRRISEILERLVGLRATTPAGLLARAMMTDFYQPGWWTTNPACCDEKLAVGLLDDVLAIFGETPAPAPQSDGAGAELVRRCEEYLRLSRLFAASDATCEDDDPAWQAVTAAEDRIYERRPETMADIMALAKVSEYHARQPDGSMNYSDSFTGQIPARIIECLLRFNESACHG
jgi:hypothetical protein